MSQSGLEYKMDLIQEVFGHRTTLYPVKILLAVGEATEVGREMDQSIMCKRIGEAPTTIHGVLVRMLDPKAHRKGEWNLVEQYIDPEDYRRRLLKLTPRGLELYRRLIA